MNKKINLLFILENPDSNWIKDEINEIQKFYSNFHYVSLGGYVTNHKNNKYLKINKLYLLKSLFYIILNPIKSIHIISTYRSEIGIRLVLETFAILMIVKKLKINHIHCHFASAPTTSAFIIKKLSTIHFSFTAHAYDIFDKSVNIKLLKEKMDKASFIRVISDYNKKYLSKLSPRNRQKIQTIHCGINLNNFPFQKNKSQAINKILTASNLVPKKGLVNFLKTTQKDDFINQKFKWIIAGNGKEKEKILSIIKKNDLNKIIELHPFIPHNDLLHYFKKNDLFFLPCIVTKRGNRDGIPVILIEAMASGIITISSNVSGIPELIKNNETGFVLKNTTIQDLIKIINQIKSLPNSKIEQIRLNARKIVETEFNIKKTTKKLIKEINKCH